MPPPDSGARAAFFRTIVQRPELAGSHLRYARVPVGFRCCREAAERRAVD